MIQAQFPFHVLEAAAASPTSRTIEGVAVPYGVPGRVSTGDTVVFEPGALDAASRPVTLRDHDRTRPIGRVVDARDAGDRLLVSVRVSATRDGDDALTLAADGVLGAFSVGVDPTDASYDADGVLRVRAGDWQELSLLTIGAFSAAQVQTVTASLATKEPAMSDIPDPDVPEVPDPEDPDTPETVEAARPRLVPVTASRGHPAGGRDRSDSGRFAQVGISQLAGMIWAAQMDNGVARQVREVLAAAGPIGAGRGIEAALQDVTLVGANNVGAAYRPGYQAELVEIVAHGTPMIDALSQADLQRGDYPNVTFNRWNPAPTVALYAPEKSPVASTAVGIVPDSAPVQTWAGGNDISQATLDLGSPSFVEDYIRAAAVDYARKSDTYAVSTVLAEATDVTTVAGDDFTTVVGKLFAGLNPANVPAGQLWLGVSWDQAVSIIGVKRDEGPAFWDGSISFGGFLPSVQAGGMSVFVDPNMPARTWVLGMRQAATWYDLPGTPFNLRAVNAANLGLDVVVYGYGACGVKFPGALVTTTVPVTVP